MAHMRNQKGNTVYGDYIKGDATNHNQQVRFDMTDGYLGISQKDSPDGAIDRVLLTPAQLRALLKFVGAK